MFLENAFIYLVAAFTSVVIFFLAEKRLGMGTIFLSQAVREAVQCVGASIAFFIFNMSIGVVLIFAIRSAGHFFPLYTLADTALVILSAIQGFIFHLWWRRSHSPHI